MKKKGVKVDRFLIIVWKISNLDKSICLIYKIRNFLTSGLEIYAIWVKCLVNKLSQITDVKSGFLRHIVTQIRTRKMVTHLGTHLFIKDKSNVCTMLLICVGNHKYFV